MIADRDFLRRDDASVDRRSMVWDQDILLRDEVQFGRLRGALADA